MGKNSVYGCIINWDQCGCVGRDFGAVLNKVKCAKNLTNYNVF